MTISTIKELGHARLLSWFLQCWGCPVLIPSLRQNNHPALGSSLHGLAVLFPSTSAQTLVFFQQSQLRFVIHANFH